MSFVLIRLFVITLLLAVALNLTDAFKPSIVDPETGEMKFVIKYCNSSGLCSQEDVSLIPEDLWRGCSDPITCSIVYFFKNNIDCILNFILIFMFIFILLCPGDL